MKNIITSISSFEELIKADAIYVDKTDIIYSLIEKGPGMFFCSRPRRFGKTLTLSTFEAIFKGKKELFKGLKIYDKDYDWNEYPVIHIDLGKCQKKNAPELASWFNTSIINIALDNGIELRERDGYDINFDLLIQKMSKKGKLVILIDEYDKILSSNIYNPDVEEMRDVLRGFFEVIKASSALVRFVFITGVTKFSKVSIFSSMNNLSDISLSDDYSLLFGYTELELEHYFGQYIEKGMRALGVSRKRYLERVKRKYDGNRFTPRQREAIYNPVSIGSFFFNGGIDFDNYWINTGATKLIMDVARYIGFDISKDITTPISKSDIAAFDILEMASNTVSAYAYKSLLFQCGYLTIRSMNRRGDIFVLDFPNEEVAEAYSENLLAAYTGKNTESLFKGSDLRSSFDDGNTIEAIEKLRAVYASIAYDLLRDAGEAHYSTAFFCMMKALGARIGSEIETSRGRIDAVLENRRHVYIFEFKYNKTASEALKQIVETKYYEPYMASKKKIHLVGMNFSSSDRNINEWKEEIM